MPCWAMLLLSKSGEAFRIALCRRGVMFSGGRVVGRETGNAIHVQVYPQRTGQTSDIRFSKQAPAYRDAIRHPPFRIHKETCDQKSVEHGLCGEGANGLLVRPFRGEANHRARGKDFRAITPKAMTSIAL